MHLERLPRQKLLKRLVEAVDGRLIPRNGIVFEDGGELADERLYLASPAVALHHRLLERVRKLPPRQLVGDLPQFVRKLHLRVERLLDGLARRIRHVPVEFAVRRRNRRGKFEARELVDRLERGVRLVRRGVHRLAVALGEVHLVEGVLQRGRVDSLRRALGGARKEDVELTDERARLLRGVAGLLERVFLLYAAGIRRARAIHAADRLVERDADVLAWLLDRGQSRPHAVDRTEISMSAHLSSSLFRHPVYTWRRERLQPGWPQPRIRRTTPGRSRGRRTAGPRRRAPRPPSRRGGSRRGAGARSLPG